MTRKKYFGLGFNRLAFAFAAAVILIICGILSGQAYYETAISVFSVVMLMYLVEGKRAGCVCGIIYCVLYAIVCFSRGFYGLASFNFFFAMPMYTASLFTWSKNKSGDTNTVAVRRFSHKNLAFVIAGAFILFGCAYMILKLAGSSGSTAVFDGLTLSFAAFGTVLLALRFVEQWYFNLAANATVFTLWVFAAVRDVSNLNFVICAAVFVVSNAMALFSWLKMAKLQNIK